VSRAVGLLLLALYVLVCASCAEQVITPNAGFAFKSPHEQHDFETRARAGDIEAARRLANYYWFYLYDKQKALYWLRIAASHGDEISKKNIRTITQRE
jgi:TPR repeat protein